MIRLRLPALGLLLYGCILVRAEVTPGSGAGDKFLVDEARLDVLEKTASTGSADAQLELALAYDERGQKTKAIEYYQQAAAAGIGVAELRLGWLCESGIGIPQSYDEARRHYERAVTLGVPEANLRLGLHYLEGWGVPRDVPAAVAHMQAAADAGYQPAQRILSEMYFSGTGVTADLKQALAWAEKASAQNDPLSQALAGAIRQRAARLPGDIQAAREWYQLSAEQDYTVGMRAMATTFLKPGAAAADVAIGLHWLELAAEGGDLTASFYLAGMYLWHPQLRTVAGNSAKAEKLLKDAAKGGHLASAEVLEAAADKPLADAFRYVTSVPIEQRHIRRMLASAPTAEEVAKHQVRPRPVKMARPIYPAAMKLAKIDGQVVVQFVIDTTGRVRDVKVLSATHPAFTDQATACIVNWRFVPGLQDGRIVNVRAQQEIRFVMASEVDALDVSKFRPKAEGQ